MSEPLGLGIVGCGRLVELGYLPALDAVESLAVRAVADPDRERREQVAARAGDGATACAAAEDLVQADGVDAVLVASPPAHHPHHAALAAAAGLPCLVEKPPALDAEGARQIALHDPAPWIGLNRRFADAGTLRNEVPAQGKIELDLEIAYMHSSWRPHTVRDDAITDLGCHLVDLALFLAGAAQASVVRAELGDEHAEVELEFDRGRALLRAATRRPYREVAVVRSAGAEVARVATPGALRGFLARVRGAEHPLVASMRAQLEAFARAARGGDPGVLATAADGVRAMELIDEARRVAA
jgi:predicted dehydrogenase